MAYSFRFKWLFRNSHTSWYLITLCNFECFLLWYDCKSLKFNVLLYLCRDGTCETTRDFLRMSKGLTNLIKEGPRKNTEKEYIPNQKIEHHAACPYFLLALWHHAFKRCHSEHCVWDQVDESIKDCTRKVPRQYGI